MDKKTLKKYLVGDMTVWRLIRSLIFVYVSLLLFAFFGSDRMIFQPQPSTYKDDSRIIKIEMPDGPPISAIYQPVPSSGYTILYNHANAVDLGDIGVMFSMYNELGFSIFSYDYRGYGTSPGRPTASNAYKAADAAMKYLAETESIPLDRIIVHGRSVGGGPALYLAQQYEVAGAIVESSFVSAFRVMTHIPISPFDKFKNIARIDDIDCPLLVIHGRDDHTIPFWHGVKLFNKAKEPKMSCWLNESTHNFIPAEAEKMYWMAITSFIDLIAEEQGAP